MKTWLLPLLCGIAGTLNALTPEALEVAMRQAFGEPKSQTCQRAGDDLFHMEFRYVRMMEKPRIVNLICAKLSDDLRLRLIREAEPAPLAEQAAKIGAVAGINAGRFCHDPEKGWLERGFCRIEGRDLPAGPLLKAAGGGYLTLDREGRPALVAEAAFDPNRAFSAVWTFPLLLLGGKPTPLPDYLLVTVRHPRSAFGMLPDNWVVLLAVAGRHPYHAVGMETEQVVKLLQAIGCTDAALLDGGSHSSLYWAPEGGPGGIVNYPPDNHLVDHEGACPVSSVLVLVRP